MTVFGICIVSTGNQQVILIEESLTQNCERTLGVQLNTKLVVVSFDSGFSLLLAFLTKQDANARISGSVHSHFAPSHKFESRICELNNLVKLITRSRNTCTMASASPSNLSLSQHMARAAMNGARRLFFCCSNRREKAMIKKLEHKMDLRKKAFGVTYLDLSLEKKGSENELKACVFAALADIEKIKNEIRIHERNVEDNNKRLKTEIEESLKPPVNATVPVTTAPTATTTTTTTTTLHSTARQAEESKDEDVVDSLKD